MFKKVDSLLIEHLLLWTDYVAVCVNGAPAMMRTK